MPILIFLSNMLGQPIIVTIVPTQLPRIEFVAPVPAKTTDAESVGACYQLVCKA